MRKQWAVIEHAHHDDFTEFPEVNTRELAVELAKDTWGWLTPYDRRHRMVEACLLGGDPEDADIYETAWCSDGAKEETK